MTEQQPCCTLVPELNDQEIGHIASIFHLLGDAGRLQLVLACIDTPKSVAQLSARCGMSQPLTSHHLRQLREARVLKSERQGKQIFYTLQDFHIRHVILDLASHVKEPIQ
ncbi:HTH-type transcriptional regulator KmtR [invertebrate metagenome]|uniref:HTH-type transcriptional regulator KmtR n=1 Tax=invertebrate metagenome TaxID=1711999 RepID=A0A2H9TA25_9ZZZZ